MSKAVASFIDGGRCPDGKTSAAQLLGPLQNTFGSTVTQNLNKDQDAPYDEAPQLDARTAPWPLFVMVLIANGWFWEPRVFNLQPGNPDSNNVLRRQRIALARLVIFCLLWIAAFVWLPTWLAAALLVAWGLKIWPGVRRIHKHFQHVEAPT